MPLGLCLSRSWDTFRANPLGEAIATAFFLLGMATGLLTGVSTLLYTAYLRVPAGSAPGPVRLMLLPGQIQGRFRISAAFWLGLILFVLFLVPSLMHPFLGFPAWYVVSQPVWVALILTALYDLPLGVALRAVIALALSAPGPALALLGLGLLAFSGVALFGIGLFVTVPVAFRAALFYLEGLRPEVTSAIQKGYQ